MWGEPPASADWQRTLNKGFLEDGWSACENVPSCYRRQLPGGADAIALVIVDDILISEPHVPGHRHPLALMLHKQLEARYGLGEVRLEHEPTSFVGYTVLRDRPRHALTINMAAPIEAAVREHIPEYVDGATLKSLGIPEGKKMRDLVDALRLLPPDAASPRLSPHQRLTASIIGKCRW